MSGCYHRLGLCVPVESVEHLYGNEDREGHGHGVEIIKYRTTTKRGELRTVNGALEMVGLCVCVGGGGGGGGGVGGYSWVDTPHDRAHGDLHVTYTLLLRLDHPNFISYGPSKLRTHTHSPADSN